MDGKMLYCIGQHFKSLHEQCKKGQIADFGEACEICNLNNECDFNKFWLESAHQLEIETGIQIKLLV